MDLTSAAGKPWRVEDLYSPVELDAISLSYSAAAGDPALRAAIGTFLGVPDTHVCATAGASEALMLVMVQAHRNGGTVLVPNPGYPAVPMMARALGLEIRNYDLRPETGFRQWASAILAATDASTCLVVVNSPHNPTGSRIGRLDLMRLATILTDRGIPLVVDEVFWPLGTDTCSAATIVPGALVVGDLSKAFSLPGLRTGWIAHGDAAVIETIAERRAWLAVSGSPLLEAMAVRALASADRMISRVRNAVARNEAFLRRAMVGCDALRWAACGGAPVALLELRSGDAEPFCRALASRGVLALPGEIFGANGHFRIGLAGDTAEFEDAAAIILRLCSEGLLSV